MIEEEEKIDELLQETHNIWSKDVERSEQTYDRQELIALEDEKFDLITQCAQLEHDVEFLKRLNKLGRQFLQTGKPGTLEEAPAGSGLTRLVEKRSSDKRLDATSTTRKRKTCEAPVLRV